MQQLNILDGPASPIVLLVENTKHGLDEEDEMIGQQWRNALVARGFTTTKRQIDSEDYGGPEKRKRHYEVSVRVNIGLGALL